MDTTEYCPACGGESHWIGTLGWSAYFRCRDCGWEFHLNLKRKK